ncbi:MAG: pitrilysin family protein, partial [Gammaproteobacteria bacterium]
AINEELNEFLRRGPTRSQLERVKTSHFASLIRGLEKVGGFSGKAQLLATYEIYLGDASRYKQDLEIFENATADDVRDAARRWLSSGDHNLEVLPRGNYKVAEEGADRSQLPDPGPAPELEFPEIQDYQLENGIRVLQVQRGDLPVVSVSMQFDAGYAADPHDQLGTAALMSAMLDEGTEDYDALELSARAEELGAVISTGASLDANSVGLSALSANLEDSLELLREVVLAPSFDERELERVRSNWLDQIAREKTEPFSLALRNLPPLLYGDDHPYGIPFTGSGTEESISVLTAEQLRAFHQTWIRPDNAKMVVVGNLSRQEVEPLLNDAFGDWDSPDTELPGKNLFHVDPVEETIIYLMDKPGSPQSMVIGGHLLPPNEDEDREELDMAVRILGGNFNARLNMNLREDKGWAYGARASSSSAVGQRPLIYYAPVQIDKTVDSLKELIREANDYLGDNPATLEELNRSKDGILRSLPGRYETNGSVAGTLQDILKFDRPLDYVDIYQREMEALSLDEVQQAANDYLMPNRTVWLIVGDLSEIE